MAIYPLFKKYNQLMDVVHSTFLKHNPHALAQEGKVISIRTNYILAQITRQNNLGICTDFNQNLIIKGILYGNCHCCDPGDETTLIE